MRLERMWVNQPSTTQAYHCYHGKNVLVCRERGKDYVDAYFTEGTIICSRIHISALSKDWNTPNPMYCVSATIQHTDGVWTKSREVPTFFLSTFVQGIAGESHAERIACDIINPANDPNITVNPNVKRIE